MSFITYTGQNISGVSTLQLVDVTAPGAPGSGLGVIYKKTGSGALFYKHDTSNTEIDLTAAFSGFFSNANNSGYGLGAASAITTGVGNMGVGYNSVHATTSGNRATGVGQSAIANNNNNDNTGVGASAIGTTTNNINAVMIGSGITTFSNTGYSALIGANVGSTQLFSSNNAVGANAFKNVTSSISQCLAFGYNAISGASAATGQSVGFGSGTMTSITSGTRNTAVGFQALSALTIGQYNTAFGYQAGNIITTANNNICLGNAANVSTTSIGNGIAIGSNAIVSTTNCVQLGQATNSGTSATLKFRTQVISREAWIGAGASGYAYIDSTGNVQKGTGLPSTGINGPNNTGFGLNCLVNITSGTGNAGFGYNTLNGITSGTNNAAFGQRAGKVFTTSSKSSAFGFKAGYTSANTGNLFIGANSGVSVSGTATYNHLIGNNSIGGLKNVNVGFTSYPTFGNYNVIVGSGNFSAGTFSGSGNVVLGHSNFTTITSSSYSVLIGTGHYATTNVSDVVCIGTGQQVTGNGAIAISAYSGLVAGVDTVGLGGTITAGGDKSVIICGTLSSTFGSNVVGSVGIGRHILVNGNSSNTNTFVGISSFKSSVAGVTTLGINAGNGITSNIGTNNITCIGTNSGGSIGTGNSNTCIGISSTSTSSSSNILTIGNSVSGSNANGMYIPTTTASVSGGVNVQFTASGEIVTQSSSERYKQDIVDAPETITDSFDKIQVKKYIFNNGSLLQYGMIAEELVEIYPDFVPLDLEGQPFSINYERFAVVLIKEAQQLRRRISNIRAQKMLMDA